MESAINATQVEVKFNVEVNTTAAETEANYSIAGNNPTTAELSEDGKLVTLTFASASHVEGKDLAVVVDPIETKANYLESTKRYVGLLTYEDNVKADVASITSKTNDTNASSVEISFTEPVAAGAQIKINGSVVGVTSAGYKTTINSGITLDSTKEHTLEVVNLTDGGGNVTSLVTKKFTIVKDNVAPTVSKVEASRDNAILVTFDKKVTLASVQSKVSVKDEVLGSVNIGTITTVTAGATTSDTQFKIPVSDALYSTSKTRTLNVVFDKDIVDTLGNKSVAVTKTVSLTKDEVKPAITSIEAKKDSDGKTTAIVANFSEGIANLPSGFDETQIRVVSPEGTDVTSGFFKAVQPAVAAGAKKATIDLTTATKLNGVYTFIISAGAISDQAQTPNTSSAYTGKIDFGAGETGKFEILPAAISSSASKSNDITINFGTAVKGGEVAGSATDVNNYTLGGKALPAGTVITLNSGKTIATIDIPNTESVAKSDSAAIFTVANVQNADGVTITPVTKALQVVDNTKAILESARALDNKTIELTFNEDIAALSSDSVGTEFKIYHGSTALSLLDAELVADSVSGFAKKVKITVAQGVDAPASATKSGTNAAKVTLSNQTSATATATVNYKVVDVGAGVLEVQNAADNSKVADVTAGAATFTLNGVTVAIATAAGGDTFTVATTAATSGTTLDLTKDLFVETLVPGTGVDVLDTEGNQQVKGIKISVSK